MPAAATNPPGATLGAPIVEAPGWGFVALPASTVPLTTAVRWVMVVTAGNMAVVLADGSDNSGSPIAVTASQMFKLGAISLAASGNTAVLIGIR